MTTPLTQALAMVKAAGYRVDRAKMPKKGGVIRKRRVGPTCVCEFSDGVVTRMSVYCAPNKLDWGRAERLSQAAWSSRFRTQFRKQAGVACPVGPAALIPPAIVMMRFEQDGKTLAQRAFGGER